MSDALRIIGLSAWSIYLVCLCPAIARLMIGRGRYMDPLFALAWLLVINRLAFLLQVDRTLCHVMAVVLALIGTGFSGWYQYHDARRG